MGNPANAPAYARPWSRSRSESTDHLFRETGWYFFCVSFKVHANNHRTAFYTKSRQFNTQGFPLSLAYIKEIIWYKTILCDKLPLWINQSICVIYSPTSVIYSRNCFASLFRMNTILLTYARVSSRSRKPMMPNWSKSSFGSFVRSVRSCVLESLVLFFVISSVAYEKKKKRDLL